MSEQANHFKLGLFVIVAVALLLGGAILLGAGAFMTKMRYAETYFTESVNGLDIGAAVKFRGVTVGKVSRIGFAASKYPVSDSALAADQGYVLVEMEFPVTNKLIREPDARFLTDAVSHGFRVRSAQSGIVGAMYLELFFLQNPEDKPPLKLAWEPEHPYIPSTESRIERIAGAAERIATQLEKVRFDQLIDNLGDLIRSTDERVKAIDAKALNASLLQTISEMRGASEKVTRLLSAPETEAALKDLPEITARVRSGAKRIDELLATPEASSLLANLSSGASNAGAAATDLRRLARRLDVLLAQQQQDIEQIILGLRRTLDNAADLTDDARQNPSRLIFGEPPPRAKSQSGGDK